MNIFKWLNDNGINYETRNNLNSYGDDTYCQFIFTCMKFEGNTVYEAISKCIKYLHDPFLNKEFIYTSKWKNGTPILKTIEIPDNLTI